MPRFEIYTEDITPCGGTKYARKAIFEAEADSPEAYVKANGRFPILEIHENADGDTVIRTGDGKGYFLNYVFSE